MKRLSLAALILLAAAAASAQTFSVVMKPGETVTVSITTTEPSEPPTWTSSPEGITITPRQNGYQADLTPTADGVYEVVATADIDLGPGVHLVTARLRVSADSGQSAKIIMTVGTPH